MNESGQIRNWERHVSKKVVTLGRVDELSANQGVAHGSRLAAIESPVLRDATHGCFSEFVNTP